MTRISVLLRTAAFAAQIVAIPALAASPSQEFLDHFTAQSVTVSAPASTAAGSRSDRNPSADYLAGLKGDTGGYVAGAKVQASSADPRQQFLDQLAVHPLVGAPEVRASLADAK